MCQNDPEKKVSGAIPTLASIKCLQRNYLCLFHNSCHPTLAFYAFSLNFQRKRVNSPDPQTGLCTNLCTTVKN
jgi:hypothetical protein